MEYNDNCIEELEQLVEKQRKIYYDTYPTFEAMGHLTEEEQEQMLRKAFENYEGNIEDIEISYYRNKLFCQMAQEKPEEERKEFFFQLNMQDIAVVICENEVTCRKEARIVARACNTFGE